MSDGTRLGGVGGGAGRLETERTDAASGVGAPGAPAADGGAAEAQVVRDAARMQASGQAFQLAQMARLLEAGHGPGVSDTKTSADLKAAADLAKKLADASNAPGPFRAANDALAKAAKQLGEKVISGGKWDDETTRLVQDAAQKLGKPRFSDWVKESHDPKTSVKSLVSGGKAAKAEAAGKAAKGGKAAKAEKGKAKDAGPLPTKTSLDAMTDFRQIDWGSWKPTKADKELLARWSKLTPEQMETELSKMSYRDRKLLSAVLNRVDPQAPMLRDFELMRVKVDREPILDDNMYSDTDVADYSREYVEWLSSMSDSDFEAWYQTSYEGTTAEGREEIVAYIETAGPAYSERYDMAGRERVVALKARLNELITVDKGAQLQTDFFAAMSPVARDVYMREMCKTESGAQILAVQIQQVMVGNPALAEELLKQAEDVFFADMQRTGKPTMMMNFTVAAEHLHGGTRGSAAVKAAALKWIHNAFEPPKNDPRPWDKLFGPEFPRNRAADRIKSLLMSDPMGIARQVQIPPYDPQLLTECMEDFANGYPEDPQKAGAALADVLDAVSSQLGKSATKSFEKISEDGFAFDAEAMTVGYLLGAAHNAMDSYAEKWKGKVDHGKFILDVFVKGVAKISGVPAIEEYGKKVTGWLADKEKKDISKWQGEIKDRLFDLVTARMWGQVPKNDYDAKTNAENAVLHASPYVSEGYEKARRGAGRKTYE
jgi:hypothetical protein